MRRMMLVGLLVVGRGVAAPQPSGALQDRPLPAATAPEVGLDVGLVRQADSVADRELPALLSLLVVRRGKLALERYYHAATAATAINVKSVTKSIQSATVGVAREAGLIPNLDEPVAAILPELYARPSPTYQSFATAIRQMDAGRRQVTLRHLLTMSSGYGWEEAGLILTAFLANPHQSANLRRDPALRAGRHPTAWLGRRSTGNQLRWVGNSPHLARHGAIRAPLPGRRND